MTITASAVFLMSLFTCCVAPRCYVCTQNDDRCGDHFLMKTTEAKPCPDGTCVKYRGERYSNQVRIVEVTRMCIELRGDGEYSTQWNGISVKAYACNSDFCNHSTSLTHSSTVLTCFVMLVMCCLIFSCYE